MFLKLFVLVFFFSTLPYFSECEFFCLFSFFLSSNLSSWFVHYSFTSRFHHASHLQEFVCKEMMKSVGALWCHGSFSIPYILLLKLSEHQVTIIVETAFQFWFWVMFSLFFRVVAWY